MISFVPILIVIIMVISITALLVKLSKSSSMKNFFSGNRIRWILVGYISILIICTGLSPLLPKGEITYKEVDVNQLERDSRELYEAAIQGNIENVDSKYILKTWNLDYSEKQLNIAVTNEEFLNAVIIVERKNDNDGKIEAAFYKTGSSINDMAISELDKPLRMEMGKNTLRLQNPEKLKLEFSQFQHAFPINQFTGKGDFSDSNNFYEGTSILYLKIPNDLELNTTFEIDIQYVE
ncbi:hypothetical protein [Neobacillus niacini]|uniref:hypothetical protein n=1 Tax=Neobacillus niacini TaxID=86668 RepID=UPI0005EEAEF1|nr:hypothetical protein [Neobacillus niacini]